MAFCEVKAPAPGSFELWGLVTLVFLATSLYKAFALYHIMRPLMGTPCLFCLSTYHVSSLSVVLRTGFFTLKECHMVDLAGLSLMTSLILSWCLNIILIVYLLSQYFQARWTFFSPRCIAWIIFLVVNKVRLVRCHTAGHITVEGQSKLNYAQRLLLTAPQCRPPRVCGCACTYVYYSNAVVCLG